MILLLALAYLFMEGKTVSATARAAGAAQSPPQLSPIHSSATSRHFFDEHGRVRIFHGAARVEKNPPWYFKDMVADSSEAEAMAALGFNVLRLGFSKLAATARTSESSSRSLCAGARAPASDQCGAYVAQCGRDTTLRLVFSTKLTSA